MWAQLNNQNKKEDNLNYFEISNTTNNIITNNDTMNSKMKWILIQLLPLILLYQLILYDFIQ